jgi:hypothetical protein
MRTFKRIIIAVFIASVVFSCSTAQKSFNKGNYYDATLRAVKQLRTKPDAKKALAIVEKSYPMALEYHKQRIDAIAASNQPDKFLRIVDEYTLLNSMADEITRCPPALNAVKPVVYFHDQLKKAELLAVDEQFKSALKMLSNASIPDARLAHQKLIWVKQRQPNYNGIERQLAIAKDLATLKVVVEHLPELQKNYNIDSRVFYVRLFDQLSRSLGNDFLRFYQPNLAEELQIAPHEVVEIQFLEFVVDAVREKTSSQELSKDSVVIGSYTDNEGNVFPVSGTVKAKVEIHSREIIARAVLSINIKNYHSGEIIQTRKFPNEYLWRNEWATFNGDEKALPKNILGLTSQKQMQPPLPQELFLMVSDPIYQNGLSFLRSYYNKK